jgi:lipopolysaccharide export system permease protein
MLTLIDRVLIRAYIKAYIVCLISLLGLYIVVDLFTNLDEFTSRHHGLLPVLKHIGTYYGYQSSLIFDRLCEAIVLLAAMFTIAWMQRNNEMLPLLSAGVSTRRVVQPVLLCACFMLSLKAVNEEVVIPRISGHLTNQKEDPYGEAPLQVQALYEPNGIHIHGKLAVRREQMVQDFFVTIPEGVLHNMVHLSAKEARYISGEGPRAGGWLLTGVLPVEVDHLENSDVLEQIDPGKFFLRCVLRCHLRLQAARG